MEAELRRQAAGALDNWLVRFGGMAELAGVDTTPIREIAAHFAGGVAAAAWDAAARRGRAWRSRHAACRYGVAGRGSPVTQPSPSP